MMEVKQEDELVSRYLPGIFDKLFLHFPRLWPLFGLPYFFRQKTFGCFSLPASWWFFFLNKTPTILDLSLLDLGTTTQHIQPTEPVRMVHKIKKYVSKLFPIPLKSQTVHTYLNNMYSSIHLPIHRLFANHLAYVYICKYIHRYICNAFLLYKLTEFLRSSRGLLFC